MKLSTTKIKNLISNYFPNIKEKEIDIFLSITKYQSAKNKELLLKSGKPDNILIFILKGVARAYSINDKGEDLTNFIRAKGHLMGDAKVFGE